MAGRVAMAGHGARDSGHAANVDTGNGRRVRDCGADVGRRQRQAREMEAGLEPTYLPWNPQQACRRENKQPRKAWLEGLDDGKAAKSEVYFGNIVTAEALKIL